jgi:hypothetical protein
MSILKINAADMHDPIVVSVILKEGLTKVKKRNLRQAIIFQNNSFAYGTEKPVDAGAYRSSTPKVDI